MKEHPVFIPTVVGPLAALVSEPDGQARAGVVLLHGGSRRAGPHQAWVRAAAELTELGLSVMRIDYPGRGDSSLAKPRRREEKPLRQTAAWFRRETGLDLLVLGACSGARRGLHAVAKGLDVLSLGMISPYLRTLPAAPSLRRIARRVRPRMGVNTSPRFTRVDRQVARSLDAALHVAPIWVLLGDQDYAVRDLSRLRQMMSNGHKLEVEV
ncbi:MAG: alpha/beta hydrolase, partial [Candidatus Methylomirabilales bacterium]